MISNGSIVTGLILLFVQGAGAAQRPAPSPNLVEFKAGKLNLSGTTMTADPRKGKISMRKKPDGLTYFQFSWRPNNEIEDDLIVFPGDATFTPVAECTTGRVYCFAYSNPDARKRFFWLQDLKTENDAENVQKVRLACFSFGDSVVVVLLIFL